MIISKNRTNTKSMRFALMGHQILDTLLSFKYSVRSNPDWHHVIMQGYITLRPDSIRVTNVFLRHCDLKVKQYRNIRANPVWRCQKLLPAQTMISKNSPVPRDTKSIIMILKIYNGEG
ncbi:MAG: hypothetical protein B6D58_03705 [candidate division Zixibacteria bacterium 4484_95]|nr:MAG: hypothetical protein B6D58_03705 [candidate division Zixibacteria bacterium 4484_95]